MKTEVMTDFAYQDMLCRHMYDQSKAGFMDYLQSERTERGPYWENATALMVVHLTTGALESFVNSVLHLAESWGQPGFAPVTAQELKELVDCREETVEKWKWLGRRASNRCTWFDKGKDPMKSYVELVQVRNDLADHDKAPILFAAEGGVGDRRKHVVSEVLTRTSSANAIVTVTEMVRSLREAFTAGDADSKLVDPGWRRVWDWAEVREPEILKLARRNEERLSAW